MFRWKTGNLVKGWISPAIEEASLSSGRNPTILELVQAGIVSRFDDGAAALLICHIFTFLDPPKIHSELIGHSQMGSAVHLAFYLTPIAVQQCTAIPPEEAHSHDP